MGFSPSTTNFDDEAMTRESDGKVKTVTSQLVHNWQLLMTSECNINLFKNLLKNDISTRDIHSFVLKQADLRKIHKKLDEPLTRAAMRSKVNDACAYVKRQKRIVGRIKKDLFNATGQRRYLQRKIIKQVREKIEFERTLKMQADQEKFQKYLEIQAKMRRTESEIQFKVPASIQKYSGIKAFNYPESVTLEPEQPMIYDENIKLSANELLVLAKGPKFAVRQDLVRENFKLELEKLICKQKYGMTESELDPALPTKNFPAREVLKDSSFAKPNHQTTAGKPNQDYSSIEWEERKSQLVYDFESKNLNPNRLRATNYRYNKTTTLPKPQTADLELKHELRKSECLKVFDKLTSDPPNIKKGSKSSKITPFACKSNLNDKELEGLKSLQKRVSMGEIVICESDKSAKLCVLSKQQYLASGIEHCRKDLEISLHDVARLQKYVNSNVEWLHDILGTGSFWGHQDRIRTSSIDFGAQAAPLRLLLKDHKPWSKDSGKPIPSRPVVNGKAGYNNHLSELLSMILGPVAKEANGSEINSTADLLSKIHSVHDSRPSVQKS